MMLRFLSRLSILTSVAYLVRCTSEGRFNQDTRECSWAPFSDKYYEIYSDIDVNLIATKKPLTDVDDLFDITAGQVEYFRQTRPQTKGSVTHDMNLSALIQLYSLKELDSRSCCDHCTYVLAKLNCNAASNLHVCNPLSRTRSYIKSMIQSKVFPMIRRCQPTLIDEAMKLKQSVIRPELYQTLTYITEQVTVLRPEKYWLSFEDVIRGANKPFHAIRRLINPTNSGFYKNILKVLRHVDELNGGFALAAAIDSRTLCSAGALDDYKSLILKPCREYIAKMHKPMDAIIFYGRIIELDRDRFQVQEISDSTKIEFFKLVHLFEACLYLDDKGHSRASFNKNVKDLFFDK